MHKYYIKPESCILPIQMQEIVASSAFTPGGSSEEFAIGTPQGWD